MPNTAMEAAGISKLPMCLDTYKIIVFEDMSTKLGVPDLCFVD